MNSSCQCCNFDDCRLPDCRDVLLKKTAVLLDFVQMRGAGEGPAQFLSQFEEVHFWSIKGVYFLQNANNLNFKLFLGTIYDPHSKYSAVI